MKPKTYAPQEVYTQLEYPLAMQRIKTLCEYHKRRFSAQAVRVFSSPGRIEIGGNHTDHNNGRVLAAAISLDMVATVSPNTIGAVRLESKGYRFLQVGLQDLSMRKAETGTTTAMIRGIAAKLVALGYAVCGLDICVQSRVPKGSGLSSSAAFEVLICQIFNAVCNQNALDALTVAQICQYAENDYFGKPSGLMDQTACAFGGMIEIDFKTGAAVTPVTFNFANAGYEIAVVDTGGTHAKLTGEYAAITKDMASVAAYFGAEKLREVPYEDFIQALQPLQQSVCDRAILRALHFYHENTRVTQQVEALQNNNIGEFLALVRLSGQSSWQYLQNCYVPDAKQQRIPLALALCAQLLGNNGACRVHGGGFAGTILCFVPTLQKDAIVYTLYNQLRGGTVYSLQIRAVGACELTNDF